MNTHFVKTVNDRTISAMEFVDLMLGEQIGTGMSRDVYNFNVNPDYVVKHESRGESFQNVQEWKIWQEVKDLPDYAKWFAPVYYISPNGLFSIQSKVEKIPKSQFPKEIPAFLGDLKYQNFGMLNGKFVCFDYGMLLMTKNWSTKKVKAKWWSEAD